MTGYCQVCHFALDNPDEAVCRRCARNFSRSELRQVIALAIASFVLARFSYYLVSGNLFAAIWKGNLAGPFDLSGWGRFPVNMVDFPWHLLTVGCLLGLLFVTPALVATLFGHKPGIVVALVIGLFAGIPWLFLVTVPAAYLAGTRLRRRLGVAAATRLAAALPFAYSLVMTWNTVKMSAGFVTAWAIAFVLACLHVELTVFLVNRERFTGTWLTKLILPETLLVLGLFYFTVGFDTLEYECLRSRASILSERFAQLSTPVTASNSPDVDSFLKERTDRMQKLRTLSLDEFSYFVGLFPRSPLSALALYEKAELLNMKLYLKSDAADQPVPPTFLLDTARITPEAPELYKRIIRDFNNSIPAAYARLKLADFAAQHGQVSAASGQYEENVLAVYATHLPPSYQPPAYDPGQLETTWRTQRINPKVEKLAYYDVMRCARARREFIAQNSDYNDIPLMLYLEADPLDPDFVQRTANIPEWFPSANIVDNVLWDRVRREGMKLDDLEKLYRQYPHGDAAPKLLLELARKLVTSPTEVASARRYYEKLIGEFAQTPEAEQARRELEPVFARLRVGHEGS